MVVRPAHALAFILALMLRCGGLKGGLGRSVRRYPLKRAYSGAHPLCRLFLEQEEYTKEYGYSARIIWAASRIHPRGAARRMAAKSSDTRAPELLDAMQLDAGRILASNAENHFAQYGQYPDPNQTSVAFDARAARVLAASAELARLLEGLANPD